MSKPLYSSKREEILAKSLELFIARGFHGLSLAELSREIGISKPAILYYFKKPEDVFLSLMDGWAESGGRAIARYLGAYLGESPKQILIRMMEGNLMWLDSDEKFARLTLSVFLAAQTESKVREKIDQLFSSGRGRIEAMLKLSKRNLENSEIKIVALQLHSVILGALVYELISQVSQANKKRLRAQQIQNFTKALETYF